MILELREYVAAPGRRPRLVARFREHTLPLFEKHGMDCRLIGTTEIGADCTNELAYVLAFSSVAEMDEKWRAFLADPEWARAREQSEVDGPLVDRIRRRVLDSAAFAAATADDSTG